MQHDQSLKVGGTEHGPPDSPTLILVGQYFVHLVKVASIINTGLKIDSLVRAGGEIGKGFFTCKSLGLQSIVIYKGNLTTLTKNTRLI